MKMNSISGTSYLVKDLQKTAQFYEALGFRMGKQDATHCTCYVNWFAVDFIAESADSPSTPRGLGVTLQIKVENADEFHAGLLEKGMTPNGEPVGKSSTGRSFTLNDPDGYTLMFFEKK